MRSPAVRRGTSGGMGMYGALDSSSPPESTRSNPHRELIESSIMGGESSMLLSEGILQPPGLCEHKNREREIND